MTAPRVRRRGSRVGMTSTRGFPIAFSLEARALLGPAVALNDAVRETFPALAIGQAVAPAPGRSPSADQLEVDQHGVKR